jgi:hypothetical protein
LEVVSPAGFFREWEGVVLRSAVVSITPCNVSGISTLSLRDGGEGNAMLPNCFSGVEGSSAAFITESIFSSAAGEEDSGAEVAESCFGSVLTGGTLTTVRLGGDETAGLKGEEDK